MTVNAASGRRDIDSVGESLDTLKQRGRDCPCSQGIAAPFVAFPLSARNGTILASLPLSTMLDGRAANALQGMYM